MAKCSRFCVSSALQRAVIRNLLACMQAALQGHAYQPTSHPPAPGSGPSCPAAPAHASPIYRVLPGHMLHHACTCLHGLVAPRDLAQQLCIGHLKVAVPEHIRLTLVSYGETRRAHYQSLPSNQLPAFRQGGLGMRTEVGECVLHGSTTVSSGCWVCKT